MSHRKSISKGAELADMSIENDGSLEAICNKIERQVVEPILHSEGGMRAIDK
jgi:hypothetical protein